MKDILPAVVFVALIGSMFALYWVDSSWLIATQQPAIPYGEILICAAMGLVMLVGAKNQFRRVNAQIVSINPPRNLVTHGLYGVSRNPMYLGSLLTLVAVALCVNKWPALIAPLAFFLASNLWFIPAEERATGERFGDDYRQYKQRVRRWI